MSSTVSGKMSMEEARETIPKDEYYFYITGHENEPKLFHLTEDIVSDMRELVAMRFPSRADCLRYFKFRVDEKVWFEFRPDNRVEGVFWHHETFGEKKRISGSVVFKDRVWFGSDFLCESTGPPADKHQHNYKRIRDEIVLDEHVEQYKKRLLEWEKNGGWDTGWMEW